MKGLKITRRLCMIALTAFICIFWYNVNKPNAYEVCLNNKPIMYVDNINEFLKVNQKVVNYIYNKYKRNINPNIIIKKVTVNKEYLFTEKEMKKKLISTIKIPAVIMKCNNEKTGILANEQDIKEVIQIVKQKYIEKNKDSNIGERKSKVTYIQTLTNIENIKTPQDISNYILNNKKIKPLLCFEVIKKKPLVVSKPIKRSSKNENVMVTANKINMINIPTAGSISSAFGNRFNPVLKCDKFHSGVDIAAPMGSNIYAALEGVVIHAGWEEGYGKLIKIKYNENIEVLYGHCSDITVKKGDKIKRSQKIGCVGSTGRSTGPHVHFEVRENGKPQEPLKYLNYR